MDIEFIGEPRAVGEPVVTETIIGYYDPLAQSFFVDQKVDGEGVFITKCDLFFRTKDDDNTPLRFQIRTMKDGFPTPKYDKLSEVILDPPDINTSTDGSVATTFQFGAPLYLEPGLEYAICLVSNSKKYSVYISRVGENDILQIHMFPINLILDLYLNLKMLAHGKQVNGKISNTLFIEQTL